MHNSLHNYCVFQMESPHQPMFHISMPFYVVCINIVYLSLHYSTTVQIDLGNQTACNVLYILKMRAFSSWSLAYMMCYLFTCTSIEHLSYTCNCLLKTHSYHHCMSVSMLPSSGYRWQHIYGERYCHTTLLYLYSQDRHDSFMFTNSWMISAGPWSIL